MPSKTEKQKKFMKFCSSKEGQKSKKCPPLKVAKEFVKEDSKKKEE
jgi:hypothetical protein